VKVIFLDIEGVLINRVSRNTARLLQKQHVAFAPCVHALNLIAAQTNASLVVTDGLRSMGLGWLVAQFKEWEVTAKVVDVTPSPSISVANSIIRWFGLADSPGSYEAGLGKVESFVILAPEPTHDATLSPHLIRTQADYGLTKEQAGEAIRILSLIAK
jgi:hypothetical protein